MDICILNFEAVCCKIIYSSLQIIFGYSNYNLVICKSNLSRQTFWFNVACINANKHWVTWVSCFGKSFFINSSYIFHISSNCNFKCSKTYYVCHNREHRYVSKSLMPLWMFMDLKTLAGEWNFTTKCPELPLISQELPTYKAYDVNTFKSLRKYLSQRTAA